jgi:hypothetical protein
MIALTKIRDLDLASAAAAGRPAHVSAASGLVSVNSSLYVIADDELHLGVFDERDSAPGHLARLFDGTLPRSKRDRKKQKPDIEALTLLPPSADYPQGALLMLGSGSKGNRHRGALIGLDGRGALAGRPRVVDLSFVFAPLAEAFSALNIEGALVMGDELRLFQRGNKRDAANAIVTFRLSDVLDGLGGAEAPAIEPTAITSFDLGEIDGIPLCFTDGAGLPGGDMVFTAVAEDTDDPVDDGACAGAAIGIARPDGTLRCLHRLDRPYKVEGVEARLDGDSVRLRLVTDPDDAAIPAGLFSATIGL